MRAFLRSAVRYKRAKLDPLWQRLVNTIEQPIVILLYHRVTTLASDPLQLAVTPAHFREHLLFLKSHFPILRFEEDWAAVRRPAVVITFDDGYADNLYEALPILEELQVPATFFICTGHLGAQQEFWWDELERIVLGDHAYPAEFILDDAPYHQRWSTTTQQERHQLYMAMQRLINQVDAPQRLAWLAQLRRWAQVEPQVRPSHRALLIPELQQLAAHLLVTIGAHTVTHTRLAAQSPARQAAEIQESKQVLETLLAQPIATFSYPFGGHYDYTRESVALCQKAGFTKVAANWPGQVHRWSDGYQLPRLVVRDGPAPQLSHALRRVGVRLSV